MKALALAQTDAAQGKLPADKQLAIKDTMTEIVDDLAKTFSAPRERILADVTTLLRGLADKRLLEL